MNLQFKQLSFLLLFICCSQLSDAQIFKKFRSKANEKIKAKAIEKKANANAKVDQTMDKGLNKASDKIDSAVSSLTKGHDKNANSGPLELVQLGKFVTTQIKFEESSEQIKEESFTLLNDIAEIMKQNPEMKVKIVCHTDSTGDAEVNLNLSIARAASIKTYFTDVHAIEESMLETEGLGGGVPINKNDSEEEKAKNWRVEFVKIET